MKAESVGLVLLIFMLFSSAQPVTGQVNSASPGELSKLSGRVFDRNGSVVVGSKVSLLGEHSRFATVTNDEGIYSVDLPAGFYDLQISANGFSAFNLECYQIPSKGRVNIDVTLQVYGESGCKRATGKPIPRVKKRKTIIIE